MSTQIKKIQRIVFILLLILLPTQLGYHWWPSWAFVNGIRVDYFSPTLYVTDILILFLALIEILSLRGVKRRSNLEFNLKRLLRFKLSLAMTGMFLFVFLNIYFSYSPFVSIYKWLKVAEFGFLIWYVAKNVKFTMYNVKFLLIPVFYESVLAIWQFVNQGSVGGLWYWLGERTFTSSTAGIANAVINGQLVLRPYGTFPHPNVLLGFLVVSILLSLKYLTHISRKITAVVVCLAVLTIFLIPSRGDLVKGIVLRQQLNNIAIQQFSNSPLWGTGLGTSPLYPRVIQNYALVHQPIHNIFILVLSETGLLGLIGFIWLIKKRFSWLLVPTLVLGLFDHYFFTLQQGQLILALILGLAWVSMEKVKK